MVTGSNRRGFTLFEIIVTVVILSVGIVGIYEALIVSLNAYGYYSNSLVVQSWMDTKMWEVEDELARSEGGISQGDSGKFLSGSKEVSWRVMVRPVIEGSLYELILRCSWKEGRRNVNASRVSYAAIQERS